MTTREAFETEARKHGFILDRLDKSGVYVQLITEQAWSIWKAATDAALERAAVACEVIENDRWALYKGRPPYTGAEPGRADNYVFPAGMPDACEHGDQGCTDIIKRDKTNVLLPDNAEVRRPRRAKPVAGRLDRGVRALGG